MPNHKEELFQIGSDALEHKNRLQPLAARPTGGNPMTPRKALLIWTAIVLPVAAVGLPSPVPGIIGAGTAVLLWNKMRGPRPYRYRKYTVGQQLLWWIAIMLTLTMIGDIWWSLAPHPSLLEQFHGRSFVA